MSNSIEEVVKGKRFLIVDDSVPMRRVTYGNLRAIGVESILEAENGRDALQLLDGKTVDMILSDSNMPVMDGLEFLQHVRQDPMLKMVPFIMITGDVERNRVQRAIQHGVTSLIVKPYSLGTLAEHVGKGMQWKLRPVASGAHSSVRPEPSPTPREADVRKPVKPTILVVDDTPDNLQLLAGLFKDDYRVKIAHNGERALSISQSDTPPDLVLLDVMMPGMDGFEVARRLREHPTSESIPIIFVTAMTGEDARVKGLDLGAVDFVTKPIDPVSLVPKVRNFLRYVQLHKQLQSDYDNMIEAAKLLEDVEHITRHDMKGPLAGVIGLLQSLIGDQSIGPEQLKQLRMAEETALQVLNMINLSGELYRIETGRFKPAPSPTNIGDILGRIADISQKTFGAKRLSISVGSVGAAADVAMPWTFGDPMLCYSLFHNLIKNACEAAPDGSQVSVSVRGDDPVAIVIENRGAVPKEVRSSFFDKFVTHGKPNGSGLGTYSAKLLAEAQGGSISFDVQDDSDTTIVTVRLPRYLDKKQ